MLSPRAGEVEDRVAETGNHLLAAGFCVKFPDETSMQRAVAGEFEPEHRRWVVRLTAGRYKDWFAFEWERRSDLYHRARWLTRSTYDGRRVVVPAEYFEEVLDFADQYGFRLSPGAQDLANEARAAWESALIVTVKTPAAPKPPDGRLTIPDGIDDELADDN